MKKINQQKIQAKQYLFEKFQNCLDDTETAEEAEKQSKELFDPNKCFLCRKNFAIVQNLPRILVQCGHSLCSECIHKNYQNYEVICPLCNKKVKNVKSIEFLPVN